VAAQNLVVRANGVPIGFLLEASDYTLRVWDQSRNIVFSLNDTTGFVTGGPDIYYAQASCQGTMLGNSQAVTYCPASAPPPARRIVFGTDGDWAGLSRPSQLVTSSGSASQQTARSGRSVGSCLDLTVTRCFINLVLTAEIPTAFSLPITVSPQ
jgi:hypothetical protein